MKDMDNLKQQVMMNQFMFATGCPLDQAKQFLVATKWQFEVCIFSYAAKIQDGACLHFRSIYKQRPSCRQQVNVIGYFNNVVLNFNLLLLSECPKYVFPRIINTDM